MSRREDNRLRGASMKAALPLLGLLTLVLAETALADSRMWTDSKGRKVEAEYVMMSRDAAKVTLLKKKDGKELEVPLEVLSEADQRHALECREKVLTCSQMCLDLDELGRLEKSTPVKGKPRLMAKGRGGTLYIELVGSRNSLSQASLLVGIPADRKDVAFANSADLLVFMKNGFPAWDEFGDWAMKAMKQVTDTGQKQEVQHGNKHLSLMLIPQMGIFCATVEIVE